MTPIGTRGAAARARPCSRSASNVQLHTAYRCAVILRDLIAPFLLRRLKVDVAKDLPKKTEQVRPLEAAGTMGARVCFFRGLTAGRADMRLPRRLPSTQVLFCRLTPTQQDAYLAFVHSDEVTKVRRRDRTREALERGIAGATCG